MPEVLDSPIGEIAVQKSFLLVDPSGHITEFLNNMAVALFTELRSADTVAQRPK